MKPIIITSILLFSCAVSRADADIRPDKVGSHGEYIALLHSATKRSFNEIVETYDRYIRKHTSELPVRLEECKFLQLVMDDELGDYDVAEDLLQKRQAEIDSLFPDNYDVTVFRSTTMMDDSSIVLLEGFLRRHKERMDDRNSWALYEQLAHSYSGIEQPYKSIHYAVQAMRYNDTLDLTLLLAEQCEKVDDKKLATSYLSKFMDKESPCWLYKQKGDAFLRLSEPDRAMEMFHRAIQCDTSSWVQLSLGRTLEKLGRYHEAREALTKAASVRYPMERALLTLFQLDLRHGTADSATFSYNRLRDLGFYADPLGMRRLSLFIRHPFAPVRLRDIGAAFLLSLGALVAVLLPAFWIIPVHYAGLLRKRSDKNPGRWNLKKFWYISSFMVLTTYACLLIFQYETIANEVRGYSLENVDAADMAWYLVIFTGILAVGSATLMRKKDFSSVWGPRWSKNQSILAGIGSMILLRVVLSVAFFIFISLFGIHGFLQTPYEYFRPLAGGMMETLRAVKDVFGWPVLVFLGVIVAPFNEEFIFRGVALRSMQRHIPFAAANLLQALLFALMHAELVQGLFAFVLGLLAGVMRQRSSSLIPGITLHVSNNIVALLPILL